MIAPDIDTLYLWSLRKRVVAYIRKQMEGKR